MEQELHPVPSPALARGSGQIAGSFPELGINYRQRLPAKEVSGGSEQRAFPPVSLFSEEDSSHDKSAQRFRKQPGLS